MAGRAERCVLLALFIVAALIFVQYRLASRLHGLEDGYGSKDAIEPTSSQPGHDLHERVSKPRFRSSVSGDFTPTAYPSPPPTATVRAIEGCDWIERLLERSVSIGEKLPEAGKPREKGGVFWLKKPVLHTTHPETGEELMVLLYNIYNRSPSWTQHTDKFRNSVRVMTDFRGSPVLPELYASCDDIGGFHYIVVEFIPKLVADLPRPQSLQQCVDRALEAIGLFAALDEQHLTLMDFKPGQWMARADGSLVLQDVDDIVLSPTKVQYSDQVGGVKQRLQGRRSILEVDKPWKTRIFPNDRFTVRYDSMNMRVLLNDLGFNWRRDCPASAAQEGPDFHACKERVLAWGETLEEDWPTPAQMRDALSSCFETGEFKRTRRSPASWRDLEPVPTEQYTPVSACHRSYDRPETGNGVKMCEHSCCRSKGANRCYWTAPIHECKR